MNKASRTRESAAPSHTRVCGQITHQRERTLPLIQGIFYNNPDQYPAIVNGARLLARAGFRVELLVRDVGEEWSVAYPPQVSVHRIQLGDKTSWKRILAFTYQCFRRRPWRAALIVGHDAHGLVVARVLAVFARRQLVYHCYDLIDETMCGPLSQKVLERLVRRCARSAVLVTVPSHGLDRELAARASLPSLPLVMKNSPLEPAKCDDGTLRRAIAATGKRFSRIVFRQGRIGRGHAIETTIESIPYWRDPAWGFVIMGIPESGYLDHLTGLAHRHGVENRFAVLPAVSYDHVLQFTAGADLGHALYEPLQINNRNIDGACKIQEYCAASLPVLLSDRESLRELAGRYGCAVLADEADPRSIAGAVNSVLSDDCQLARLSTNAASAFRSEIAFEHQFYPVLLRILDETRWERRHEG